MTIYLFLILFNLVGAFFLYRLMMRLWKIVPSFNVLNFLWGIGIRIAPNDDSDSPRQKTTSES